MLETAKKEGYAYPAVNVTTIEVINGALRAFSEAKSDGIIQVSIGGGKFASGSSVGNSALGAIVLAEATRRLAEKHNVLVALHTDHCQPEHVDTFLRPLIAESRRRVERGEAPLFNSHMLDASTLPMAENLKLSRELLKECAELGIVLEIEIGVVGGEEDGVDNSGHPADKLYTSPEDMLMTYEALAPLGKFMLAATFGNVHGVYKPGHVKLKPSILRDGQEAVVAKHGEAARMPLVFHGGSGSELSDIREAVSYGVVKMNIDTTRNTPSPARSSPTCANTSTECSRLMAKWATRRITIPVPILPRVKRESPPAFRKPPTTLCPPARPSLAKSKKSSLNEFNAMPGFF